MKILLFTELEMIYNFKHRNLRGITLHQCHLYSKAKNQKVVKIARNLGGPFTALSFDDWYKHREHYDLMILKDGDVNEHVLSYFAHHPQADKQILHFDNAIVPGNQHLYEFAKAHHYIITTYNLHDAQKYHMIYHQQCWNKDLYQPDNSDNQYDLFFLANVKNRYQSIMNVLNRVKDAGLKVYDHVYSPGGEPGTTTAYMDYLQSIEIMRHSSTILDLVADDNYGLTFRPLEAMFLHKKLITNYPDIVHYDFYEGNKENIYVIQDDKMTGMIDFLRKPYVETGYDMSHYDIEYWLTSYVDQVQNVHNGGK